MPHSFGAVYRHVFLPPVDRAMRVLDRTFFKRRIFLAGADVHFIQDKPKVKREMMRDVLDAPRIDSEVTTILNGKTRKLLLLRPGIVHDDPKTYSPKMREFLKDEWFDLHPYILNLGYNYWTFGEILGSTLPEELGIPEQKYETLGRLGNMVLNSEFHPYRKFIAEVLLDKTPQLKTVVVKRYSNEISGDPLMEPSWEYLCGDENTEVQMAASKMKFKFDYKKCHWEPQMSFVNKTMANKIARKKVMVDVAAGVGHLSIPVAKNKSWVFANDPDGNNYEAIKANIASNRVEDYCHPFNLPPQKFIPFIIHEIAKRAKDPSTNIVYIPSPHFVQRHKGPPPPGKNKLSHTAHHFVINSRAGGISALSAFKGAYNKIQFSDNQLPWVHVYIRQPYRKPEGALENVSRMISEELGVRINIRLELVLQTRPVCLMRAMFRLPRSVLCSKETTKERRERVRKVMAGNQVEAVEDVENREEVENGEEVENWEGVENGEGIENGEEGENGEEVEDWGEVEDWEGAENWGGAENGEVVGDGVGGWGLGAGKRSKGLSKLT